MKHVARNCMGTAWAQHAATAFTCAWKHRLGPSRVGSRVSKTFVGKLVGRVLASALSENGKPPSKISNVNETTGSDRKHSSRQLLKQQRLDLPSKAPFELRATPGPKYPSSSSALECSTMATVGDVEIANLSGQNITKVPGTING